MCESAVLHLNDYINTESFDQLLWLVALLGHNTVFSLK